MQVTSSTDQLGLWTSEFGRNYTDRNDAEIPGREAAWKVMLNGLELERVLEVGCNVGWNLEYISRNHSCQLYGIEAQTYAVSKARSKNPAFGVLAGTAYDLPYRDKWFDLVFTSGVLIHIHRDDLGRAMDEMYRASRRYIAYIEYDDDAEVEIKYRGHENALWRRNHRAAWLERYPELNVVANGFWSPAEGYDNCTWCVFEKPSKE